MILNSMMKSVTNFLNTFYVYFQTPVSVAFTPTSVIRKMHSEKASEKEKQKTENEKDSEIPGL